MSLEQQLDHEIFVYRIAMVISASLSILSTILAIYLIFYKSAPEMKTYRFYLLNITCFSCANDVHLAIFYIPWQIYPAPAFCSLGLLGAYDSFAFKQFRNVSILNGIQVTQIF